MGILVSDHRGGTGIDGKKGTLQEWETISCPHCLQCAAVVLRGCSKDVPYHHWCPRCKKPVCKKCAAVMEQKGGCPGPLIAKIEAEMRAGHALEHFEYHYHSTQRA